MTKNPSTLYNVCLSMNGMGSGSSWSIVFCRR